MFKTIFAKMMWSNIAILFLSFFLTGIMLFGMLGKYAIDQKAANLREIAPLISKMTIDLQIENEDRFYRKVYLDNLLQVPEDMEALAWCPDTMSLRC